MPPSAEAAVLAVPADDAPSREPWPPWAWISPAAVLALLTFERFGFTARAALAMFFVVVLVQLAAIDIRTHKLPNRIVIPSATVVLCAHVAIAPQHALEWTLAPIAAAAFIFLPLLVHPTGMGMGDVKLALLLGAALGWQVFDSFLLAFAAFLPFAAVLFARYGAAARERKVPFGPFLAFGAIVVTLVAGPLGVF